METELQYVNYHLPENMGQVQTIVYNESLWLTEKAMADLFQIDKSGIGRHLKHIYESGELQQDMTVAKFATVVNRGVDFS